MQLKLFVLCLLLIGLVGLPHNRIAYSCDPQNSAFKLKHLFKKKPILRSMQFLLDTYKAPKKSADIIWIDISTYERIRKWTLNDYEKMVGKHINENGTRYPQELLLLEHFTPGEIHAINSILVESKNPKHNPTNREKFKTQHENLLIKQQNIIDNPHPKIHMHQFDLELVDHHIQETLNDMKGSVEVGVWLVTLKNKEVVSKMTTSSYAGSIEFTFEDLNALFEPGLLRLNDVQSIQLFHNHPNGLPFLSGNDELSLMGMASGPTSKLKIPIHFYSFLELSDGSIITFHQGMQNYKKSKRNKHSRHWDLTYTH